MDRTFPEYNRRYDRLHPLMDGHFTARNRAAEFHRPSARQRQHFTPGYSLFGRKNAQQPERHTQQEQRQVQGQGQGRGQNEQKTEDDEDETMTGEEQQDSKQNVQYSQHQYGQAHQQQRNWNEEPQHGQKGQYESQQNIQTQQTSSSSNENRAQGYYQGNGSSSTVVYEDDERNKMGNNTQNQSVNSADNDNEKYHQNQGYYQNPNGGGSTSTNQNQSQEPQPGNYYASTTGSSPTSDEKKNENRYNTESLSYSTDGSGIYDVDIDSSSCNNDMAYEKYRQQGKRRNQYHTDDRQGKGWRAHLSYETTSDTSETQQDQMDYEPSSKKHCGSLEGPSDDEIMRNVCEMPGNEVAAPSTGGIVPAVPEAGEENVVIEAECKATSLAENIKSEESPASHDDNQAPENTLTTMNSHPNIFLGVFKRLLYSDKKP